MRIMLVHNHYGSSAPSGENRVFQLERDLLERSGHEVNTLERFSDSLISKGLIGKLQGAVMTPWNPRAARDIFDAVRKFNPDVVHAHNTFPLLSPSVFSAAEGAARVLTLHNYRLVCPAAIPMREGAVCTECIVRKNVFPAIRHGCYRHSRSATIPLALNVAWNRWRGTWQTDVERFIALSEFQRDLLSKGGIPREKISVKPNFCMPGPAFLPLRERPKRAVFVGRLSEEKGVKDLVRAWALWGAQAPELRIVGEGPLRQELEDMAKDASNILFLGQLSSNQTENEIATARLLLMPSRWYETFGMVLLEAFRVGTPVAVSNIGPLPDLVRDAKGLVFEAQDPRSLFECVAVCWLSLEQLERMSISSHRVYQENFTDKHNLEMLLKIYEDAIRVRKESISN